MSNWRQIGKRWVVDVDGKSRTILDNDTLHSDSEVLMPYVEYDEDLMEKLF